MEQSRDAPWRFVFHHEPGTAFCQLTTGIDGPGVAEVSKAVEPLAWRENVDVISRGHQHLYERTYPLNPENGVRDDKRGVAMITVGGGCIAYRHLDPSDATPLWFDAVVSIHQMHYLLIRLDGQNLTVVTKNLKGEVI